MIDDMNVSEIPVIKYIIFHEISPLTARLRPVCNDINLTNYTMSVKRCMYHDQINFDKIYVFVLLYIWATLFNYLFLVTLR